MEDKEEDGLCVYDGSLLHKHFQFGQFDDILMKSFIQPVRDVAFLAHTLVDTDSLVNFCFCSFS